MTIDYRPMYYRLDEEHRPVECNLMEWAAAFEKDRRVAWFEHELFVISTVFLGLDHRFFGGGPPILFETMVFEGPGPELKGLKLTLGDEIDTVRYASWDDAQTGHTAMVKRMLQRAKDLHVALDVIQTPDATQDDARVESSDQPRPETGLDGSGDPQPPVEGHRQGPGLPPVPGSDAQD